MKNSNLTIRINENDKARLKEIAVLKKMSVSDLVMKSAELLNQIDTDRNIKEGLSGDQIKDMLALLYK